MSFVTVPYESRNAEIARKHKLFTFNVNYKIADKCVKLAYIYSFIKSSDEPKYQIIKSIHFRALDCSRCSNRDGSVAESVRGHVVVATQRRCTQRTSS